MKMKFSKENLPNKISRREFLKGVGVTGGVLAVFPDELGRSDISPERLRDEITERLKIAIDYLKVFELKESKYKIKIKEAYVKYENIQKHFQEIENLKRYRKYLNTFLDYINTAEDKKSGKKDEEYIYENAQFTIDATELFVSNMYYAQKIEKEYSISISGGSNEFFLADIESIHKALEIIPRFAIKKSGFNKLNLAEPMRGAKAEMNEGEMKGLFKHGALNDFYVYHELSHSFDRSFENGKDYDGWTTLNKGAEPYLHNSGREALEDKIKNHSGEYFENKEIPGYADYFGWEGGIEEDKATVSARLLFRANQFGVSRIENSLIPLLKRSQTDPILKLKIEFMVGHRIENGKFGKALTEQDYLDAGFPGFCYWPIWSRDENDKTWMDATYFNAILEGKKVRFLEENGRVIREIS